MVAGDFKRHTLYTIHEHDTYESYDMTQRRNFEPSLFDVVKNSWKFKKRSKMFERETIYEEFFKFLRFLKVFR